MSYEIEIKAYCESHEDVVLRLNKMGAVFIKSIHEKDLYFNHPQRDFAQTDEAFRIRESDGSACLTYKGEKLSERSKARVELETSLGDADIMHRMLDKLGFRESGVVEKTRDVYKFNDFTIVLDSIEGLGDFVEIEMIGSETERIEDELFEIARKLDLNKFERRSYLELIYFKD